MKKFLFCLFILTISKSAFSFSCDFRKTCSRMSSCEEAYYHLQICHNTRLDRDKDGIPCEKICGNGKRFASKRHPTYHSYHSYHSTKTHWHKTTPQQQRIKNGFE